MIQPSKLLEHLGVIGVLLDYTLVSVACTNVLWSNVVRSSHVEQLEPKHTYITLLLKDVPDLEPDVRMRQWARRIAQDAIEALEALLILALLLVDDPQAEQDLVRLIKV